MKNIDKKCYKGNEKATLLIESPLKLMIAFKSKLIASNLKLHKEKTIGLNQTRVYLICCGDEASLDWHCLF